jgi:ATP-binding cassette subfamily B protein
MSFSVYKQLNAMDCGPTCLRMVAKYYDKHQSARKIRETAGYTKEGVSLLGISEAAEEMGFRSRGVQATLTELVSEVTLPCILHWNQNHFVVFPPQRQRKKTITVIDPAVGKIQYTKQEFLSKWNSSINENGESVGTALLLEPTSRFHDLPEDEDTRLAWKQIFGYLRKSKWAFTQVIIALLITSFFQLLFPFLTQSIVDTGINTQNLQYITIIKSDSGGQRERILQLMGHASVKHTEVYAKVLDTELDKAMEIFNR